MNDEREIIENRIYQKSAKIIEKSLDGEQIENTALFTAIDLFKNVFTMIYSQRAEKEKIRVEIWAEDLKDKNDG